MTLSGNYYNSRWLQFFSRTDLSATLTSISPWPPPQFGCISYRFFLIDASGLFKGGLSSQVETKSLTKSWHHGGVCPFLMKSCCVINFDPNLYYLLTPLKFFLSWVLKIDGLLVLFLKAGCGWGFHWTSFSPMCVSTELQPAFSFPACFSLWFAHFLSNANLKGFEEDFCQRN